MRAHRLLRPTLGALALAGLALLGVRCFNPTLPDCSYRCGADKACPAEYECRDGVYCYLKGSTAACPFTPPDLQPPADQRAVPDGSGADGGVDDGGADLTGGD